jgi:hypothetical protein
MPNKPAGARILDDLVLKVSCVAMGLCQNEAEFREALRVLVNNLQEVMGCLSAFQPGLPQGRRAAESMKLKAVRLLELCHAVPESFDDPNAWREAAARIKANYDQFRADAGRLYLMEVPGSGFDVLGAAL